MAIPGEPQRRQGVEPKRASAGVRISAALVAAAMLTLLGVAASIAPAGDGHGTHTQLGMPACGWAVSLDAPCPTCGMTTAFAHAAEGDMLASLVTQPAGAVGSVAAALLVWAGGWIALTGARLHVLARPLMRGRVGWIMLAGVLAAWGYKAIVW